MERLWPVVQERVGSLLPAVVASHPRFFKQFIKFAIVGTIGTVVDFSILIFLKEFLGFNLYVANGISFSCAVLNNYTWNSLWTFGDQAKHHAQQLAQFAVVSIIGLALSQGFLYAFHDILGLWYIMAKGLAIVCVLFWNFLANRYWTFRRR
jgi:dolichol-phosphate mannosyltransferase